MKIDAVVLEGRRVRLEPLDEGHAGAMAGAAGHEELWRYMPFRLDSEAEASGWIAVARGMVASQVGLVYATIERESGKLVGSTGFLSASIKDLRIEIGATWVTPARQRSPVNTEAKYLMLEHAFDTWGCRRVEFKTDALNQKSRNALLRIGAKEEGTLRSHMLMPDGRVRDSVYFSILEDEWPGVRERLQAQLVRPF